MKKEIYSEVFEDRKITSVECADESVSLSFENGSPLKVETYHEQYCCESVYGDFDAVKSQFQELVGKELKRVVIKSVEEMGILINFITGYSDNNKIFVACYNNQNGYYSSSLSLKINNGETTTEIDIDEAVEDNID